MGAVFDIYLELKNDPDKDEIVRWTKLDIWSDDGDTHCVVKEGRAFLTYKFD